MSEIASEAAVRRALPDWWIGAGAMPAPAREDWLHLLRVAAELEEIPAKVHEPMIQQIRLAWWRELVQEIYAGSTPRPHPLALRLQEIIEKYALPERLWMGLFDAMAERFDPREEVVASSEEWLFALAAHLLGLSLATAWEAKPWQELGRAWTLLHNLRLQAFSAEPDAETIHRAARQAAGSLRPQASTRFWRAHDLIVSYYLRRLSRGGDVRGALLPSRVGLPLRLLLA